MARNEHGPFSTGTDERAPAGEVYDPGMARYGVGALILGAVLAASQLWLALVWLGVLVGLVLLLLGVATLAGRSQARGFPLADQLYTARMGIGIGLPVTPPRHHAEPTLSERPTDPADHRRLIREVEEFLREHRPT